MRNPTDDEKFFQAWLDAESDDQAARWLLTEWLAERGDPNAAGYGWMVGHDKAPGMDKARFEEGSDRSWDWWSMRPGWNQGRGDTNERRDRLDPELLDALAGYAYRSDWSGHCAYCEYRTRQAAEEALVRVLLRRAR